MTERLNDPTPMTCADHWQAYRDAAIPKDASAQSIKSRKALFYAAMAVGVGEVLKALREGNFDHVKLMEAECETFMQGQLD